MKGVTGKIGYFALLLGTLACADCETKLPDQLSKKRDQLVTVLIGNEPQEFSYKYSGNPKEESDIRAIRQEVIGLVGFNPLFFPDPMPTSQSLTSKLINLQGRYPNNPELIDIAAIIDEYRKIEMTGRTFDAIDMIAIKKIEDRIKKEIALFETDDHRMKPEKLIEKHPSYQMLGNIAQQIGFSNIEYLVRSKKNSAPTVIIAPQQHNDMLDDEVFEIAREVYEKYKQENKFIKALNNIHEPFIAAFQKTKPKKMFLELVRNRNLQKIEAYYGMHPNWKNVFSSAECIGLEEDNSIDGAAALSMAFGGIEKPRWRVGYTNLLMADLIIDNIGASKDQLAGVIIGCAHEQEKETISLSAMLAASGLNIVVLSIPKSESDKKEEMDAYIILNANKMASLLVDKKTSPNSQYLSDIPQMPENEDDLDGVIKEVLALKYPLTAEMIKKRHVDLNVFVEIVKKSYFFLFQKTKDKK